MKKKCMALILAAMTALCACGGAAAKNGADSGGAAAGAQPAKEGNAAASDTQGDAGGYKCKRRQGRDNL